MNGDPLLSHKRRPQLACELTPIHMYLCTYQHGSRMIYDGSWVSISSSSTWCTVYVQAVKHVIVHKQGRGYVCICTCHVHLYRKDSNSPGMCVPDHMVVC